MKDHCGLIGPPYDSAYYKSSSFCVSILIVGAAFFAYVYWSIYFYGDMAYSEISAGGLESISWTYGVFTYSIMVLYIVVAYELVKWLLMKIALGIMKQAGWGPGTGEKT